MLDDEGRLGLRPSAARRQDLREATAPGAAARITHSGHLPTSGLVGANLRVELSPRRGPPLWVSWTPFTACSAPPRARAPSRARSRRPAPSPATRAANAAPRTP